MVTDAILTYVLEAGGTSMADACLYWIPQISWQAKYFWGDFQHLTDGTLKNSSNTDTYLSLRPLS